MALKCEQLLQSMHQLLDNHKGVEHASALRYHRGVEHAVALGWKMYLCYHSVVHIEENQKCVHYFILVNLTGKLLITKFTTHTKQVHDYNCLYIHVIDK